MLTIDQLMFADCVSDLLSKHDIIARLVRNDELLGM